MLQSFSASGGGLSMALAWVSNEFGEEIAFCLLLAVALVGIGAGIGGAL